MPDARQYVTRAGACPYERWFFQLEARAAARVAVAVRKLEAGLRPDTKAVGEGVFEARIDYGPGYRIYFGLDGVTLVILLGGGDKTTQRDDIPAVRKAWADYKARKYPRGQHRGNNP